MGRLLRLLLGALAHGLRAIAGRLQPATAAAPAAVADDAAADGDADGPPQHWLAMVRLRAPGLHHNLQERGITRRPAAPRSSPAAPSAMAPTAAPTRGDPPPPAVTTRRMPVVPSASDADRPASRTVRATDEPSLPPGKADAEDDEEWTRAPTRRMKPITTQPAPIAAPPPATAPGTSDADRAAARLWRANTGEIPAAPHADARSAISAAAAERIDPRREPTRPILRPLPRSAPASESAPRRPAAAPSLAPARDEDHLVVAPAPPLVRWPSTAARHHEGLDDDLDVEEVGSPFPALPDETPHRPLLRRTDGWPAPATAAHRRREAGLAGWPEAPDARSTQTWSGDDARWPELPADDARGGDGGLPAPAGHRERLAQEQRGCAWNG